MSVGPRPSKRTPCSITRRRMTFFWSDFHAAENSCPRRANASSPSVAASCAFASSFTAPNAFSRASRSGTIAASSLPANPSHRADQMSSP